MSDSNISWAVKAIKAAQEAKVYGSLAFFIEGGKIVRCKKEVSELAPKEVKPVRRRGIES